jgi:Leucine-rich repeat (LRR) protein
MKKIILVVGIIMIIVVAILMMQGKSVSLPINNSGNGGVVPVADKVLDLSNKGLTSIPIDVFNQTNLEELNVSHNNLTGAIQSQIGQLKNLKIFNASYNKMTGVPAEIGQLQNLESLDLSYNQLTGLPNELGNLQKLKILNLTGNNYSQHDFDYIHSKLPADTIIIAK